MTYTSKSGNVRVKKVLYNKKKKKKELTYIIGTIGPLSIGLHNLNPLLGKSLCHNGEPKDIRTRLPIHKITKITPSPIQTRSILPTPLQAHLNRLILG